MASEGSPALTRKLESELAVKLDATSGSKKIVVSAQDIKKGTTAIRESPVIIWKNNNWLEFFMKFKQLSKVDQSAIESMSCLPLSSPHVFEQEVEVFKAAFITDIDIFRVRKLSSVCLANKHEYYGEDCGANRSFAKSALFLFSSRVSRSCNPNSICTSRTSDGKLELRVIKDVSEGQVLSLPWFDTIWTKPTHLRRMEVEEANGFLCQCDRCNGIDHLRIMMCDICQGDVICSYNSTMVPSWTCDNCGSVADRTLCEEKEEEIDDLTKCYVFNYLVVEGLHAFQDRDLELKIAMMEKALHPHNYLVLQALKFYMRLCEAKAEEIEEMPPILRLMFPPYINRSIGDPDNLRSKAASAGIKIVSNIECIASGCNAYNRTICENVHPIVYQAVDTVLFICLNLMKCPTAMWPLGARPMIRSYLPAMKFTRGESNSAIATIEQVIFGTSSMAEVVDTFQLLSMGNNNSHTLDDAESSQNRPASSSAVVTNVSTSGCSRPKPKGKGKKKRGGGSTKKKKKRVH